MADCRCLQLRWQLCLLVLLLTGVVGQQLDSVIAHSVPLLKEQINLLHFAPGRVMDDGLPTVYRDERFTYTFDNLPEWLQFEDSKLVGIPPINQTGSATIRVSYKTLNGSRKGTSSVMLSYGDNSTADGNIVTYFVGALGFNRTLRKSVEKGEFVVLIPLFSREDLQQASDPTAGGWSNTIVSVPTSASSSISDSGSKATASTTTTTTTTTTKIVSDQSNAATAPAASSVIAVSDPQKPVISQDSWSLFGPPPTQAPAVVTALTSSTTSIPAVSGVVLNRWIDTPITSTTENKGTTNVVSTGSVNTGSANIRSANSGQVITESAGSGSTTNPVPASTGLTSTGSANIGGTSTGSTTNTATTSTVTTSTTSSTGVVSPILPPPIIKNTKPFIDPDTIVVTTLSPTGPTLPTTGNTKTTTKINSSTVLYSQALLESGLDFALLKAYNCGETNMIGVGRILVVSGPIILLKDGKRLYTTSCSITSLCKSKPFATDQIVTYQGTRIGSAIAIKTIKCIS